jgi:hypothetical protein
LLYHLKATAAPDSITVFRANLLGDFSDVKNWHWALVSARGIPPAAPNTVVPQQAQQQATTLLGPPTVSPQPLTQPTMPSSEASMPADKH